jgi:hypothetical protein
LLAFFVKKDCSPLVFQAFPELLGAQGTLKIIVAPELNLIRFKPLKGVET